MKDQNEPDTTETSITSCHCKRCHRDWWPRKPHTPVQCPSVQGCGSYQWNEPYASLEGASLAALIRIRDCPVCRPSYEPELSHLIASLIQKDLPGDSDTP
jgi:hypothetical protein